jgi:hypothetical protein
MEERYVTVSFPSLELQKGFKAFLPTMIDPIPNKTYRVQAPFAFRRYSVFEITLNGHPLA